MILCGYYCTYCKTGRDISDLKQRTTLFCSYNAYNQQSASRKERQSEQRGEGTLGRKDYHLERALGRKVTTK